MKLFERWLAHSFDWQSLGLALLIVIMSFLLIRGVVQGIFILLRSGFRSALRRGLTS